METILAVIFEVIILILFRYPGSFIVWTFTGFRKPFKEVLNGDAYTHGMIGLVFVVGLIVLLIKVI